VFHERSKHIEIKYYFIRDKVQEGEVKLEYIPIDEQRADILTKPRLLGAGSGSGKRRFSKISGSGSVFFYIIHKKYIF
jgi:hypothetical protein